MEKNMSLGAPSIFWQGAGAIIKPDHHLLRGRMDIISWQGVDFNRKV